MGSFVLWSIREGAFLLKNRRLKTHLPASAVKKVEFLIEPLGFDWKIGIALITSFAAREVFVGTMATLYSVEGDDNNTLREKMAAAVNSKGEKVYTLPYRYFSTVFLCVCHAMYEHFSHCKKRNQQLAISHSAVCTDGITGLCIIICYVSFILKIKFISILAFPYVVITSFFIILVVLLKNCCYGTYYYETKTQ
jgi:Fe2+ transport system protein B